jgi:hypothetical protein
VLRTAKTITQSKGFHQPTARRASQRDIVAGPAIVAACGPGMGVLGGTGSGWGIRLFRVRVDERNNLPD